MSKSYQDRIREMQQQKKKDQEEAGGADWIKWEEGDRKTIRLLPDPDPDQTPFREYALHYGLDRPIHCLAPVRSKVPTYEACPMCQYIQDLKRGSPKEQEWADALKRNTRAVWRAVNRADDPLVPKKVAFRTTFFNTGLHDQICDAIADGFDVLDVFNGCDLKVYRPPKQPYTLQRLGNTPLLDKKDKIDALLERASLVDIDEPSRVPADAEELLLTAILKVQNGELVPNKNPKARGQGGGGGGRGRQSNDEEEAPARPLSRSGEPPRRPACFASPEVHNPDDPPCQACEYFTPCSTAVAALKGSGPTVGVIEEEATPEEMAAPPPVKEAPKKAAPKAGPALSAKTADTNKQLTDKLNALKQKRLQQEKE